MAKKRSAAKAGVSDGSGQSAAKRRLSNDHNLYQSRVSEGTLRSAISALLGDFEKREKMRAGRAANRGKTMGELMENDVFVYLCLTLKQPPFKPKLRPIAIPLKHSLYTEGEHEVCFFVKDPQRLMKDYLAEHGNGGVTRVMGIDKLRKRYGTHESRRELLQMYDLFIVDNRVAAMMPQLLGNAFLKTHKMPLSVDMRKDVVPAIKRTISSTSYYVSQATSSTVRVGKADFSVEQLEENVAMAIDGVVKRLQNGWSDVQSLSIKTNKSPALPIYVTLPTAAPHHVKEKRVEGKTGKEKSKTESKGISAKFRNSSQGKLQGDRKPVDANVEHARAHAKKGHIGKRAEGPSTPKNVLEKKDAEEGDRKEAGDHNNKSADTAENEAENRAENEAENRAENETGLDSKRAIPKQRRRSGAGSTRKGDNGTSTEMSDEDADVTLGTQNLSGSADPASREQHDKDLQGDKNLQDDEDDTQDGADDLHHGEEELQDDEDDVSDDGDDVSEDEDEFIDDTDLGEDARSAAQATPRRSQRMSRMRNLLIDDAAEEEREPVRKQKSPKTPRRSTATRKTASLAAEEIQSAAKQSKAGRSSARKRKESQTAKAADKGSPQTKNVGKGMSTRSSLTAAAVADADHASKTPATGERSTRARRDAGEDSEKVDVELRRSTRKRRMAGGEEGSKDVENTVQKTPATKVAAAGRPRSLRKAKSARK